MIDSSGVAGTEYLYSHGTEYLLNGPFFLSLGIMDASLVAEVADGSSNIREVWKLSFR